MEISLTLGLPHDELSVPIVRRICSGALRVLGADPEDIADLELAITEACANVLRHAGEGSEYAVTVVLDDSSCAIEVVDRGEGLDPNALNAAPPGPGAETGRGIGLMQSLVDSVRFTSSPREGTVVRLTKQLRYSSTSPAALLREPDDEPADAPASEPADAAARLG